MQSYVPCIARKNQIQVLAPSQGGKNALGCLKSKDHRFVGIFIAMTYALKLVFFKHFLSCDASHLYYRGSPVAFLLYLWIFYGDTYLS